MNQKEKMLYAVLDNKRLMESYHYTMSNVEDLSFHDALVSKNPIIASVAKIIDGLSGSKDQSVQKQVYTKLFQYLNSNLFAYGN